MPTRTPDEIRASIEQNRQELGESLGRLRDEVTQLTDWRSQLRTHQSQLTVVAAGAGFVLGGGIGGLTGLLRRKKKKPPSRAAAVKSKLPKKS